MKSVKTVSVIIPTMASTERGDHLHRAIYSILTQQEIRALPIVVANGPRCDPEVLKDLEHRNDIRYIYLKEGPKPRALHAGLGKVDTPYFAILDDDDLFLPHAMITRIKAMESGPQIDFVVTNGILRWEDHDEINISDFSEYQIDPLRMMLVKNWMLTGSALFRTDTVPLDIFTAMPMWFEDTYLALRLCLEDKKVLFINNPTIIHHMGLSFSLDQSRQAILKRPQAMEQIIKLDLPRDMRIVYERYLAGLYFNSSLCYFKNKKYSLAWNDYKKSVTGKGGLKYLPRIKHFLMHYVHYYKNQA